MIAINGSHQVQKLTVGEIGMLATYLATINAAGDNLAFWSHSKEQRFQKMKIKANKKSTPIENK